MQGANLKNIKINLKELRKSQDLTQQELAESLGVSRQSIIAVEAGKFLPSIELALQMADFFNTTIESLVECESLHQKNNLRTVISMEENMPHEPRWLGPSKPFGEVDTFRNAMDRLVEDFFGDEVKDENINFPSVDITQKGTNIVVNCEVPGLEPDSIDVSVSEDRITMEGERKSDEESKNKEFYRREIRYGHFSRTISLPKKIDADKAKAKFKNGLLTIEMPLVEERKIKGKKLTIEPEN